MNCNVCTNKLVPGYMTSHFENLSNHLYIRPLNKKKVVVYVKKRILKSVIIKYDLKI
jgi:hypothetical protein